jgi:hypothetical protein
MLRLLSPGDVAADIVGLSDDANRVIFRMFINTLVWGAIGTGILIAVLS